MSARPGKGGTASKASKPRQEPRWMADESLRARLVLDAKQRIEDARRGGLTT